MATGSKGISSTMPKHKIKVGIIGGSGLDDLAKHILREETEVKPQPDSLFEFPSTKVTQGTIDGVPVAIILRHGEGHRISPSNVNYRANIESLKSIGCTHILATTACGSLIESISPGELVIPDSFIDRTHLRKSTFFDGTAPQYAGVCHVPMEPAFHPRTSKILVQAGKELGMSLKHGATIVTIEGPRFSSKAESKAFQLWGGHLVNMTTCPEVMLAKEAGILYASIAMATDYDCWRESDKSVCVADVMKVFKENVNKVTTVLVKAIKLIGEQNWDEDIENLKKLVTEGIVSKR
ncbi:S-methyl-5'-thioadenosine phosphorylase isoform X2 [Venturia canescens]|uniref:S-methyl-5'-thioadenosine phosphorylase isoform X2 n=1 Tax=Venturia canescens TaxID=32260 RepID=UPI001C9BF606|nr:S-methyl-5'-thioadenosine phosphorylase isoform X2 [Venturia canescens]